MWNYYYGMYVWKLDMNIVNYYIFEYESTCLLFIKPNAL